MRDTPPPATKQQGDTADTLNPPASKPTILTAETVDEQLKRATAFLNDAAYGAADSAAKQILSSEKRLTREQRIRALSITAAAAAPSPVLAPWQNSVVRLWSPTSRSSGFLIDPRGLIATNQPQPGTGTPRFDMLNRRQESEGRPVGQLVDGGFGLHGVTPPEPLARTR